MTDSLKQPSHIKDVSDTKSPFSSVTFPHPVKINAEKTNTESKQTIFFIKHPKNIAGERIFSGYRFSNQLVTVNIKTSISSVSFIRQVISGGR